jgi:hypothetical protein
MGGTAAIRCASDRFRGGGLSARHQLQTGVKLVEPIGMLVFHSDTVAHWVTSKELPRWSQERL